MNYDRFYYIKDHTTNGILFVSHDAYLVNNLKEGILDCYCHTLVAPAQESSIGKLIEHCNKDVIDTGIKFVNNALEEFALDEFPILRHKQNLIKIRKPGFEKLLSDARRYRSENLHGFHSSDLDTIKSAISNQNQLNEYARIIGMSPSFAKQELSMIVESIQADQFKIFTICNLWKQRINQCESSEEIKKYIPLIWQTFWASEIPNV
jgi:hypothetical protein